MLLPVLSAAHSLADSSARGGEQIAAILQSCCEGHAARKEELLAQTLLSQRGGPIAMQVCEERSFVAPLGQVYVLKALDGPAEDFCKMLQSLKWSWTRPADCRTSLQILQLIFAPGMGKVSLLSNLVKPYIEISKSCSWSECFLLIHNVAEVLHTWRGYTLVSNRPKVWLKRQAKS